MPKKDLIDVNLVDKVRFVINKGITFKNPLIIEGFQGIGLVGTLSAQYLTNKLNFECIGYIDSEGIPPIALLVIGELRNPVKIFANKKRDMVIIESELSIPRKIIYELSEEITRWAKKIKAKRIICMEGIAVPEEKRNYEVFGLSTDKRLMNDLVKKGVKKLSNGIIIGMSAELLLKSMDLKVPAICLMVESREKFPDGMAAAAMLETLSRIYDFTIDVSELRKQASAFEQKIEKVLRQAEHLNRIEGKSINNKHSIYG